MALVSELSSQEQPKPVNSAFVTRFANILKDKYGNLLRERYPNDKEDTLISKSVAAVAIAHFAGVDDQIAVESVYDGYEDGGIDAFYISNIKKVVVVVQAKYKKDGLGTWKESDLNKFQKACDNVIGCKFDKLPPQLCAMKDKIMEATASADSPNYRFYFVMAHTGNMGASKLVLTQMQEWQQRLDEEMFSPCFHVHLFARDDIAQFLSSKIQPKDIHLDNVKIYSYGLMEKPYRSYFGYVDGQQIQEWYQQHDKALFTQNIRGFLGNGKDKPVNQAIQKSLNEDQALFWYLNNGITLLTKEIQANPRNASDEKDGLFNLKDVSIVNGAQTVNSIGKFGGKGLDKVKVAIKVIMVDSDELADKITEATNQQNAVSGRDFVSLDAFQENLARQIDLENYHYTLQQSSDKEEKDIDIDEALDAIVCYKGNPSDLATLKGKRGRFYDDINSDKSLYRAVFDPKVVTGAMIVTLVKINRYVERIKDERMHWYPKNTKEHKIVVHSYRAISHLVIQKYLKEHKIDLHAEPIEINQQDINVYYEHYLARIIAYMELLDGIHMPRFFENVTKLTDLFNAIREEEGDTLLAGGSLSLYNTSISRKDLESLSFL